MANLSPRQQAFVEAYLGEASLNATEAYKAAGYKIANDNVAAVEGARLLRNPKITKAIAERRKTLSESTDITPEKVLALWWARANVNVNEIVEYRRDNCRYCWGEGHAYQWTQGEYEQAQREADANGTDSPDAAGGFGFIATREPNPECPECAGEGKGKVHVHDTRRLKGAARQMYRGVHQGKDGLKALVGDPDRALEQVTKILGMYESKEDKERKRLENERLRNEMKTDDAPATPVKVVVEVKDARKRDADA
ncbi:terminase small subunit [Aquitalea sp. USM4]|uniref:terminase small subunit n=1 Tax=Aquitalea sp. USM4 TaxID=1590041 RepID=UPI00103D01BB|nr:terminase small subunit [Aquitalea sp. USM4]QBJ80522.1 terminase small subunit [Aquitalea sp. USM4]